MAWRQMLPFSCSRRRNEVQGGFHFAMQRALGSAACALRAALGAVGAAGGGWALLAAARAAAEAAGVTTRAARHKKLDAVDDDLGDEGPVPRHIAVIMDGNRRYGRREHGSPLSGHRAGGERLRDFIDWCAELGVEALTVFAFSTENWKRGPEEVSAMMGLFLEEVPRLGEHALRLNVRVRFLSSDAQPLSADLRAAMQRLEERSASCSGMRLNVCVSYGGRGDIAGACRQLAQEAVAGEVDPQQIDDRAVAQRLLTADIPDPDVLIRTSGERRLSNFLMFQLAYAELFFLEKHWPEVTREDLMAIVAGYRARHRRFGK
uniref:Alkyl transferase n=1 Tax=Alexandrium catenella TaxID=2925 RepID=A0A7S1SEG8_ALECA